MEWETPSGLLLSPFRSPGGSKTDGVPADCKALAMMPLISAWRHSLPLLWRQDRPWWPMGVTSAAHKHWCGWTSSSPIRKPTAIRDLSLTKHNPKAVEGRAWIQVPDGNELLHAPLYLPPLAGYWMWTCAGALTNSSARWGEWALWLNCITTNRVLHDSKPLSVRLPWSACRRWGKTLAVWTHAEWMDAR